LVRVKIYIEGGGRTRKQQAALRKAFRVFLEEAGFRGAMPGIVCCGGRTEAYDDFRIAMNTKKADSVPLLLVDSEDLVSCVPGSAWEHLGKRVGDQWEKPPSARDDQAHLMVCVMESWFLADPKGLSQYFGSGFKANKLPSGKPVEEIPKADVLKGLGAATMETTKGRYDKNRRTFDILEHIDPNAVAKASPWAAYFLETLRDVTGPR